MTPDLLNQIQGMFTYFLGKANGCHGAARDSYLTRLNLLFLARGQELIDLSKRALAMQLKPDYETTCKRRLRNVKP